MKYTTYKSNNFRNCVYALLSIAIIVCTCLFFKDVVTIVKVLIIILSVISAFLLVLSIDGLITKRSVSSIILFYVFKVIPIKDRRNQKVFENYMKTSSEPYHLNEKAIKKYDIKPLDYYDDTYVIDKQQNKDDLVIFYIHGGGYWVRPYGIHFTMFNKIAEMLKTKIIIPIYPLAPAHHAKEANEMVLDRYMHIINENNIDPKKVIFMGDSAGAGLALSLMQIIRDKNYPLPREAILFSPWVDVSNSTPGMSDIKDPFLNLPNLTYGGEVYAEGLEGGVKNPMASPIYGNMNGLPKITAFGGTYDSLNLDAEKMAEKAQKEGFDYTIYVYPKMIHGYAGFFFTPEAKYAIEQVKNVVEGKPVTHIIS